MDYRAVQDVSVAAGNRMGASLDASIAGAPSCGHLSNAISVRIRKIDEQPCTPHCRRM
jgi:hypothetical protein